MKQIRATSPLLAALLLLASPPVTVLLHADAGNSDTLPLSLNQYGTRGLSQTGSAEALGEGRTTFGLELSGYPQLLASVGEPSKGAAIFTGLGALSYGVNDYLDVFASSSEYGILGYTNDHASGLGAITGGLQGALPLFLSSPFRFAAQAMYIQGLSSVYINTAYDNKGDRLNGYDFFEVQPYFPAFTGKLLQTAILGGGSFRIHANEGFAGFWKGQRPLLLLSLAGQYDVNQYTFGLEANSRSTFQAFSFMDPFWVTPSVQYRTNGNINLNGGVDIALSQARVGAQPRSLEAFRIFAGIAFSFNVLSGSIIDHDHESITPVPGAVEGMKDCRSCDSLTLVEESNLRNEMHDKSTADSMALLNAQQMLADERAKRTDPEIALLTTGLYELDTLYFETALTGVSINSQLYLNLIAKMLLKYPKLQIEVAGHTDNEGGAVGNMRISQRRAEAVMNYLIAAAPELSGRLTAKGYGLTQPVASNATARGRMHNRRVELRVLNKEALQEYNP